MKAKAFDNNLKIAFPIKAFSRMSFGILIEVKSKHYLNSLKYKIKQQYEGPQQMDPITKWLVRSASAVIILAGLLLSLIIPIFALKINSQISIVQESVKEIFQLFVQQVIS